ncbi:MAG TPA: 50S ribosomal protein L29 [Candidatus Polarisedimenticolaceae bacterium]|nr:50S ribosomal protein L29 [Candidatus Polarisedimenticolaceae bacterium]
MKYSDITKKNDQELAALVRETQEQIRQLAIEMRTKQVPNIKQMHQLKRLVAQSLTEQRQRALQEERHG